MNKRSKLNYNKMNNIPEQMFLRIVNNVIITSETGAEWYPAQFESKKSLLNIFHTEGLKYIHPVYTYLNIGSALALGVFWDE